MKKGSRKLDIQTIKLIMIICNTKVPLFMTLVLVDMKNWYKFNVE